MAMPSRRACLGLLLLILAGCASPFAGGPSPATSPRGLVVVTAGGTALDAGTDAEEARWVLRTLPGIGPWTADYIAMRALGHPDITLPGDLGVRRALAGLAATSTVAGIEAVTARWRPWRSYATLHLWRHEATAPARAS